MNVGSKTLANAELVTLINQLHDVETLRKTITEIPAADRLKVISQSKYDGKTLMYHAVEKRCTTALQLLTDYVCDPNIRCTEKGRTCLHLAVQLGDEMMCKIIIEGFGSIDIPDEDGKFASEMHPTDPAEWSLKLNLFKSKFDEWMREQMLTYIDVREAQNYRRTFDCFDSSGDGVIEKFELRKLLFSLISEAPTEEDLEKFYDWFDKDKDGRIDWKEFLCAIVKGFLQDEALAKKKKKRVKKGKRGKKGDMKK